MDPLLDMSSPPAPGFYFPSFVQEPPIFLAPSSFEGLYSPSPLPAPPISSPSHHIPKAAIVGGGVVGSVVAVAVVASVVTGVAGKLGLSCLIAPLLKIIPLLGSVFSRCCPGLDSFCEKFCYRLRRRRHRKDQKGDIESDGDQKSDDDWGLDILFGSDSQSPNTLNKDDDDDAPAHKVTELQLRASMNGDLDQLTASAHAFLAQRLNNFVEEEFKKHTQSIIQPLQNNFEQAQNFLESLRTTTSDVSNELRVLKSSANSYVRQASKMKESVEELRKVDIERVLEKTIKDGLENVKKDALDSVWAAKIRSLQNLLYDSAIIDEKMILKEKQLGKATTSFSGSTKEDQEGSKHSRESDWAMENRLSIVQMVSGAEELPERANNEISSGKSGLSSAHVIKKLNETKTPDRNQNLMLLSTSGQEGNRESKKETEGAIVPVPTKAMASVPAVLTPSIDTATETSEPGSKKGRREKLPSNLGHVSFSCEMSLYKLNFFTSCKSGGSFKSPPSSPVNIHPHDSYNNFGKHQIDEYQTYLLNQKNLGRSYNDFALNSFNSNIAPQAGLVTSNNALHNNHYFPNHSALTKHHYYTTYPPDYQQSICIATPTQQAASVSQPPVCNQHHPTDYGCPFDGVL